MALTASDIAAIKTYLNGVYSSDQLVKWTNPDVRVTTSTTINDTTYTNMINSAYSYYTMFFSQNFATTNVIAMDVMCRTVIQTMMNWRNEKLNTFMRSFLIETRRAIVRQQMIKPVTVDLSENPKNPDSSRHSFDGIDYDGKL